MKPLKLEFQAFGPFKDKVEIDFEQFSHQGLFLVCGPTGSGKTTIFDAMFYALYGHLSSADRSSLGTITKSHFADEETLCYVKFEFEVNREKFIIYRQPEQRAKGARDNIRHYSSVATLQTQTQLFEKVSEVQREINTIIGLTAQQFKQIVLLPQGEFKQLLFAGSNEKEAIFRDLFKTDEISRFTALLKEKTDTLYKEITLSKQKINIYLNQLKLQDKDFETLIESEQYEVINQRLIDYKISLSSTLEKDIQRQTQKSEALKQVESQIEIQNDLKKHQNDLEKLISQEETIIQLEQLNEQIKTLLELSKDLDALITIQKKVQETQTKINEYQLLIDAQTKDIMGVQRDLTASQEEMKRIEQWEKKHEQLVNQEQQALENIKQFSELKEIRTKITQTKLEIKQMSEKKETDLLKQEKIQEKLDSIAKLEVQLDQTTKALQTILLEIHSHQTKLNAYQNIDEQNNRLKSLIEVFETLKQKKKVIDQQVTYFEIKRSENIAQMLAADLKEGEPCPVCGSIHHPLKAHSRHHDFSEAALEKLKTEQSHIQNEFISSAQSIKLLKEQKDEQLKTLEIDDAQFEEMFHKMKNQENSLNNQHVRITQEISNLNKEVANKKEVEESFKELQKQIDQLTINLVEKKTMLANQNEIADNLTERLKDVKILDQIELEQLRQDITNVKQKIKQTRDNQDRLTKQLFALEKTLTSNTTSLKLTQDVLLIQTQEKNQAQTLFEKKCEAKKIDENSVKTHRYSEADIKTNQAQITQYYQNRHATQRLISENEKKLEMLTTIVDDPLTLRFSLLTENEALTQQIRKHQSVLDNLKEIQERFELESQRFKQLNSQYYEISPLYNVASGDKSTGYLSFERYVLASYFEEVLEFANERLLEMTQDRYRLMVAESALSRQRSAGLDVEVFDHYTSLTRPVKTLSGGETFKASLALALGLSDVISQKSGGIHIDALFVDEGFGSLDEQSLDSAIETLLSINQDGRLVGIISHVKELRDRISNQIIVEKHQDGSTINIVSFN